MNDGSSDDTDAVVRQLATGNPDVRVLDNPGNRGKGFSVRNGMLHAHGDVMLFTDADLSSPIYEADKLFRALEQGADIAIGSRWLDKELQTERQPWHRQLYGRLFNGALRVVLDSGIRTHSAASKRLPVPRRRRYLPGNASNAGDSIPSYCSWLTNSNCGPSRSR